MLTAEPVQATDPHLVWGKKEDRLDRRFQARAAIVECLISRWTQPHWTGADVSGGAGRWLSTLAPHFSSFSHLDLSPEALQVARNDHPELSSVEYGMLDLVEPQRTAAYADRTWDVIFCLDTLLYRGRFVETALRNMRALVRPGGIAIIDMPMLIRGSISQHLKGKYYRGPERKFLPKTARALAAEAGFTCLATAYHFSELPLALQERLAAQELTNWIPWPSTWMYLVLGVTKRQ
jgi:SAM-dependent methyltransferase